MNPSLDRQLDDILNKPGVETESSWGPALAVAARTLTHAADYEMTSTTVVGALGRLDADELCACARAIADDYGLSATVTVTLASFSVRFLREVSGSDLTARPV